MTKIKMLIELESPVLKTDYVGQKAMMDELFSGKLTLYSNRHLGNVKVLMIQRGSVAVSREQEQDQTDLPEPISASKA